MKVMTDIFGGLYLNDFVCAWRSFIVYSLLIVFSLVTLCFSESYPRGLATQLPLLTQKEMKVSFSTSSDAYNSLLLCFALQVHPES